MQTEDNSQTIAMRHLHIPKTFSHNIKEIIFVVLILINYSSLLSLKTKEGTRPVAQNCTHANKILSLNDSSVSLKNISKQHNATEKNKVDLKGYSNLPNGTKAEKGSGCVNDQSRAICHTYIHSMYRFYSTVSQFFLPIIYPTFTTATFCHN